MNDTSASVSKRLPFEGTWRALGIALIMIWAGLQWSILRPEHITVDWNGWRQADTQSMALRFLEPGSSILFPKVNWGGDGPGYVESELPLYAYAVSVGMRLWGISETTSQAVSLSLVAAAAFLTFCLLERRWGGPAALAGLVAFFCSKALVHSATAVQPEPMSLFFGVAALSAFLSWRAAPARWGYLGLFGVLGAAACLTKPTALQMLIVPLWLVAREPVLRQQWRRVALVYSLVAAVGIAYLLHAHSLFLEHGNTFGLLSGGDRKTPLFEHLLRPRLYLAAVDVFLSWGPTFGVLPIIMILLWRKRWDNVASGLLIAAALWSLASWRYSTWGDFGSHYMVFGALFGAWLTASLWASWQDSPSTVRGLVAASTLTLLGFGAFSYGFKWDYAHRPTTAEPLFALGRELGALSASNDLVIVRSTAEAYDAHWKTVNNYEEPMVLYESRRRGWVLAADAMSVDQVEQWWFRGARYFADPVRVSADHPLRSWLETHARRIVTAELGDIWQLEAPVSKQRS